MNKNLKGKSYNDVMSDWAAQRSFLQRASSGMLRPGFGVSGPARIWSWVWRLALFTGIPALLYAGLLQLHGSSGAFITQLTAGAKKFLGAESVAFLKTRWDLSGDLHIENLKAKGSPSNIFSDLEISNLTTSIKVPAVFKTDWHLKNVSCFSARIDLRAGGAARPQETAAASPSIPFLTAGWGINPDFSRLAIDSYDCSKLTLNWGRSPSTTGGISESKAKLIRKGAGGLQMLLQGGTFHQGWLQGLAITEGAVAIGPDKATISAGSFTTPEGGRGNLSGEITLGEVPDISAGISLEKFPLHLSLPDYFQRMVKATVQGTIKLSGSTNLTAGVVQDVTLTLNSGLLSGIPVFRALEVATGESQIAQPAITGGSLHFTSQGSPDTGGILINADRVDIECGPQLRIGLTLRHERSQVMAANVREAAAARQTVTQSTAGTLRIGIAPEIAGRLKPSIQQEFFTREDMGLRWMEIPFRMEDGDFTRATADRMVALHYGGK